MDTSTELPTLLPFSEQVRLQAEVLDRAAKESPMALYAGMLRGDARELADCARALDQAEGDGIEGAQVVNAGVLRRGVHIYWHDVGPARVIRTTQTGILAQWDRYDPETMRDPSEWVNVLSAASFVVVIP